MAVTSVPWDAPVPSPSSPPVDLRRDIEGLRPFAVLLVVTYHVWLGRVSGGVDVFLLLSAFFLYPGMRAVEGARRSSRTSSGTGAQIARGWQPRWPR
jgi:peptidoglycan/LPS O-acetylase OafA/YrhL